MRGVISNAARKQQIIDFGGLRFGNITPTDIDGMIEYHGKAYAILEFKYGDAALPYGQRLCLERMVRDFGKTGKHAIAVVAEHSVHDTNESIPAAQSRVRELYSTGMNELFWRPPAREMTALDLLVRFFEQADRNMGF